ncbi:MAG: metalloregulator ArsR/SmtB family transcription factor [Firmicutes bacterium]|nr:metalloregulator ArsR/SmtB family transcription factor [Bacillota bacterium]
MDEKEILKLEEIYKLFGSAVRLKILLRLEGGECHAGELAEVCGLSQSATSHQLKDLRQHNIIKARKDGMNVFYSLADSHIIKMLSSGLEHITGSKLQ